MATIAEEKKDDDGYLNSVANDQPQNHIGDKEHDSLKTHTPSAVYYPTISTNDKQLLPSHNTTTTKKSPFLLLLCASGITSCYLWYGNVQEHIFHMDAADGNGEGDNDDNQSITLFLLATGTFSSFLLAWIWTIIGPFILSSSEKKVDSKNNDADGNQTDNQAASAVASGRLNHPLIVLTSLTYLSAMAASNESLHYVSYPTCVLAKSAKLIPTMVVGWIVSHLRSWRRRRSSDDDNANHESGKNIKTMEWVGAALITIGIVSFQYIQLHKQSKNNDNHHNHGGGIEEEKGDSPYGLALLLLSLSMDGFLGACQSVLKQQDSSTTKTATTNDSIMTPTYRPPSAMETMLYINLYATLILLPASHYIGQFQRGLAIMFSNSSSKSMMLLQLNLSASLGQVFIFLTIHHFSPLTCTTITTTRKFFTILLSVYKFGHVLDVWQWVSIGLVFGGLYLQIVAKIFEQHHHDVVDEKNDGRGRVEKKKKIE
ncbi:hypothetical protein ACHAXR_003953 [Thalassiosira sp. AJA248-18]